MRFDLFSSGRLYKAMREGGYPDLPAERTLRDWIRNDAAPQSARAFVAGLLGPSELATGHAEAPPPAWARELTDEIRDEIAQTRELVVSSLAVRTAEALEPHLQQLLDALARLDDHPGA